MRFRFQGNSACLVFRQRWVLGDILQERCVTPHVKLTDQGYYSLFTIHQASAWGRPRALCRKKQISTFAVGQRFGVDFRLSTVTTLNPEP